jgi:hypothetical protein
MTLGQRMKPVELPVALLRWMFIRILAGAKQSRLVLKRTDIRCCTEGD